MKPLGQQKRIVRGLVLGPRIPAFIADPALLKPQLVLEVVGDTAVAFVQFRTPLSAYALGVKCAQHGVEMFVPGSQKQTVALLRDLETQLGIEFKNANYSGLLYTHPNLLQQP